MKTPGFTRTAVPVLFGEGDREMVSCSLLEYLALKAKCEYLSDLRYIGVEERWMREFILRNRADFSQDEWKEACIYLTGHKASTEDEAVGTILQLWTDAKYRTEISCQAERNRRAEMNRQEELNRHTDNQNKI